MFHVAASLSTKHGRGAAVGDGVRRRGERERRHEHLVARADTVHGEREVQRGGAARHRHHAGPPDERRQTRPRSASSSGPTGATHPLSNARSSASRSSCTDVGRTEEDALVRPGRSGRHASTLPGRSDSAIARISSNVGIGPVEHHGQRRQRIDGDMGDQRMHPTLAELRRRRSGPRAASRSGAAR